MKIKIKELTYDKVLLEPSYKIKKPKKPTFLFKTLMRLLSNGDLKKTNFKYESINMEGISKKEPILILMNHSSFIDLKIASKILYPRNYNIVCTDDGFVGKEWLMRNLGCLPARKFISDPLMVRDVLYAIKELHNSILLYPEAGYSFDGTSTVIPNYIGKFIKMAKVPVVMIKTNGAYLRDPLYNNLQLRKVDVSATIECILKKEDVLNKDALEINNIVNECFKFDNFKYQQENNIEVNEDFRADYLNRVLYKCPHCMKDGEMSGKGTTLKCMNCGEEYELTVNGYLENKNGNTIYNHIPDWYNFQRECIRKEIEDNTYKLELDVDIYILKNYKCIYKIGSGTLKHDINGFELKDENKLLDYKQSPLSSYSLNSDFYWYEIGDTICIGDEKMRYYCFPKTNKDVVAKARLAQEEIYKYLTKNK